MSRARWIKKEWQRWLDSSSVGEKYGYYGPSYSELVAPWVDEARRANRELLRARSEGGAGARAQLRRFVGDLLP